MKSQLIYKVFFTWGIGHRRIIKKFKSISNADRFLKNVDKNYSLYRGEQPSEAYIECFDIKTNESMPFSDELIISHGYETNKRLPDGWVKVANPFHKFFSV